jgi:deoxycytidylate deaminase
MTEAPPPAAVDAAIRLSQQSPCMSQRGAAVFVPGRIISAACNDKPRGFVCTGTASCKATCRIEAVHAEQRALLLAGPAARYAEMVHVKTVRGALVPSGLPSCWQCSKLILDSGILTMWLYHPWGWTPYHPADFHRQSLDNHA